MPTPTSYRWGPDSPLDPTPAAPAARPVRVRPQLADAKVIDLSSHPNPRNRIQAVGVEIEGLWKRDHMLDKPLHPDGSVNVGPPSGIPMRECMVGEIASDPMSPAELPAWVARNYPFHSNNSCGLHVHLSFKKPFHYQRLMSADYQMTLLDRLEVWGQRVGLLSTHPLFPRLAGNNTYCKVEHLADGQVLMRDKNYSRNTKIHRYTAVNYPLLQHGTIEIRVLPTFETADLANSAIAECLLVTNQFLATTKREVPVTSTWILTREPIEEVTSVCVSSR